MELFQVEMIFDDCVKVLTDWSEERENVRKWEREGERERERIQQTNKTTTAWPI